MNIKNKIGYTNTTSKYGDIIISRFGTHDSGKREHGLITLNFRDKEEKLKATIHHLKNVDTVVVKSIDMKQW